MKEITLEEFKKKYGEDIEFNEDGIADLGFGFFAELEDDTVKIYEESEKD
ncbi:MAG: hypothetical protein PVF58_06510 [Candidatus Methanofastidiosia archaeon]|jgi:hypothetical protein